MIRPSSTRLAATAAGLALALAAGANIAAAEGGEDAAVNTTCTYSQVVDALNGQSPDTAELFNSTPMAQMFLQTFMDSAPPQREELLEQVKAIPDAAQFVGLIQPLADTCHNYPIS